jgi:glycosyltransferase involved in cell wall biosynthesis
MPEPEFMNGYPLVTVYIPCRNYGRFLTKAVESVFAQLHENWELFIVDEASGDDTLEVAERLRQRAPDRVRVIHNEACVGLQKVANTVLGLATGRYMVRLDADDWFDESALLLMVAKLESSPNLGLVYGNYYYTDADGNVLGIERRHKLGVEDLSGQLPPHGACTMFGVRALKAAGGYSEEIDAQDGWELWYKLSKRVGVANLDAPLFYYRQHGTSLSRDSSRLLTARARIFERIGAALDGNYAPSCVSVIGVRESYPGFEGVPFRTYGGQSLLELAILNAAASTRTSHVVVSTESERVLAFAKELERDGRVPSHVRLLRAKNAATDPSVPIRGIMLEAGEFCRGLLGAAPDIVTFLSIHAVHRRAEHIDKALNLLRITESDTVVSVTEEREPLFDHGPNGLRLINPGRFHELAYDRERVYRFNGAILASWWEILQSGSLLGDKIAYVEMSSEDSLQIKSPSMLAGNP